MRYRVGLQPLHAHHESDSRAVVIGNRIRGIRGDSGLETYDNGLPVPSFPKKEMSKLNEDVEDVEKKKKKKKEEEEEQIREPKGFAVDAFMDNLLERL